MSNQRRLIIILLSVGFGTLLSMFLFKLRRGQQPLDNSDTMTIVTNFVFSLAIILGIGYVFVWRKKKD